MKTIERLLDGVKTLAVVCTQWGDTGKGKFVDFFAEWADIIIRGNGGANAGHTICINGQTIILHLIPSGILYDRDGKVNVIGSGVAFDPRAACKELAILDGVGVSHDRLMISHRAKLVLPHHLVLDRVKESTAGEIGTTGRGIGPTYVDHNARRGLTVNDLLNIDVFRKKLERSLEHARAELRGANADPELVRTVLLHEDLENGRYVDARTTFSTDAIVESYRSYAQSIGGMVRDTDRYVQKAVGESAILLEGAQGLLLSLDHGTYPFVTSSDCSVDGLARGAGIQLLDVDRTFAIAKAFYMTRVGKGPFPTELGGAESDAWCAQKDVTADTEHVLQPDASINHPNEFLQGIGIRRKGREFGATTGRSRRVGWLDLPQLRYAVKHTSRNVILTKVDVLTGCDRIRICDAYRYDGPVYRVGEHTIMPGQQLNVAIPDCEILRYCRPIYIDFDGWHEDIQEADSVDALPEQLRKIVEFVAGSAGVVIPILSVGKERGQTILS